MTGAVTVQARLAWLVFCAASVATTAKVCAPSDSPLRAYGLVHATAAWPSKAQVNAAPSSEANAKDAEVLVVGSAGASLNVGAAGAVVSRPS